jgi:hypothetical protein
VTSRGASSARRIVGATHLPRGRHQRDSVAMLSESGHWDADLAEPNGALSRMFVIGAPSAPALNASAR